MVRGVSSGWRFQPPEATLKSRWCESDAGIQTPAAGGRAKHQWPVFGGIHFTIWSVSWHESILELAPEQGQLLSEHSQA